ncbi:hypothetical protein Lal_00012323 [Lupinus albus]|nr:hypothetical protein Lal_00012323 [Lupinus albus]
MNIVQNFAPDTIVRYEVSHHFVAGIEELLISFSIGYFGHSSHALKDLQIANQFYNGTLLIASSQDGNRRIFLLAFAIIEESMRVIFL